MIIFLSILCLLLLAAMIFVKYNARYEINQWSDRYQQMKFERNSFADKRDELIFEIECLKEEKSAIIADLETKLKITEEKYRQLQERACEMDIENQKNVIQQAHPTEKGGEQE